MPRAVSYAIKCICLLTTPCNAVAAVVICLKCANVPCWASVMGALTPKTNVKPRIPNTLAAASCKKPRPFTALECKRNSMSADFAWRTTYPLSTHLLQSPHVMIRHRLLSSQIIFPPTALGTSSALSTLSLSLPSAPYDDLMNPSPPRPATQGNVTTGVLSAASASRYQYLYPHMKRLPLPLLSLSLIVPVSFLLNVPTGVPKRMQQSALAKSSTAPKSPDLPDFWQQCAFLFQLVNAFQAGSQDFFVL